MRRDTLVSSSTTYTYGDSAHKHAVTAVGSDTYSYDANGNMTCRVEGGITYKQEYNYENLLSAVKKMNGTCASGTVLETTSFLYDGDGNLVKKVKPGGSKTIYVGGIYEVDKTSGGSVTRTVTYYPAGGAMRINISGGSNSVYYILKDHLGSASVVTDSTSPIPQTVAEQRYYPYGETRFTSGTINTDKLFTGQRDVGLGIYHYGARFYSPRTGRFLSPDTIVPGAANPQAYNRYSYVLGNPLKYIDPSGHGACQTYEDCADMGTTPMGTGGSTNPPKPPKDDDQDPHEDDVDLMDPNPNSFVAPPVCSSSMCNTNLTGPFPPSSTQSTSQPFTTPGYRVPQFIGGAILLVGGLGFIALGFGIIGVAVVEVIGGAATGPLEGLVVLHAAAMVATGGAFIAIGVAAVVVGYRATKDAVTP